ncbi:MAG: hypothetical protein AB7F96_15105 [Beijerinckiaceae bacterium]
MNIFGASAAGQGSNGLVRNIVVASALILTGALFVANSLVSASRDGTLERIAGGGKNDLNSRMANMPRPSNEPGRPIGVRYGNVDYTTTATISDGKSRFKNVVATPSLGMPD